LLFLSKSLVGIVLTKRAAVLVAHVEASAAKRIAEISFLGDLSDSRKRSREEVNFAIQGGSPAAFQIVLNTLNTVVAEATLFAVILGGFLAVDPQATIAAVVYFSLVALSVHQFVGPKMAQAGKVTAKSAVAANTSISDLTSVFRELSVLGKRQRFIDDLYQARMLAANSQASMHYLGGMPRYVIETALLLGIGIFVAAQSLSGDIAASAGTLGVFLAGGFRLTGAILPLQNSILTLKSVVPVASSALEILREGGPLVGDPEVAGLETLRQENNESSPLGAIFTEVDFKYPNASSLTIQKLSLNIEPGSQVALIGPSGAGKSTIADLLCGVVSPTSGQVRRFSPQASSEEVHVSRGRVSYVPQRPGLVSGTILENVALGQRASEVDTAKAIEVLESVGLLAVVNDLPLGINSDLGKHRDNLSVGQLQRLGLARALYTHPGLLVVDESTSALDGESEAEIQRIIEGMKGKVTVVVIAHRLNTIQHADKVFLIQAGKLADSGTFLELLARNPSIERIVELTQVKRSEG
jgi:ATP-binding cassette subfamily C protein